MTPRQFFAAEFEPEEDADESSSMEHECWSGETADWEHLSAEQFFPLEDGGFQDLTLDVATRVSEGTVNSDPFVLS